MTPQSFKNKVDLAYHLAKDLKEPSNEYNIQRGRSHAISSYSEDLFALYMAEALQKADAEFWVDQGFRVRHNSWAKERSFNPDLGIIHQDKLTHYFDVKMNLGFQRKLDDYLAKKNQFIEEIRGQNGNYSLNQSKNQSITFSPNLIYQLVILFGWNIGKKQMAHNLKLAEDLPFIEAYVLFQVPEGHKHPEVVLPEFARLHQHTKDLFPS